MGWLGYGLYDGDDTFTWQINMIETAGLKKITLKNGKQLDIEDFWDLTQKNLLQKSDVEKVYSAWPKIEKKMGNIKKGFDEDSAIKYTMAADFFLRHGAQMPENLKELAIEATEFLISDGHANEFDQPYKRKNVLKRFKEKLENHRVNIDLDKIIAEAHSRGYETTKNLDKAVKWLFENKSASLEEIANLLEITENTDSIKDDFGSSFDYPDYMGLPKSILNKLTCDETDLIQEIVQNELTAYLEPEINQLTKIHNKIAQHITIIESSKQEWEKLTGKKFKK